MKIQLHYFIAIIFLFSNFNAKAQNFQWTKKAGSTMYDYIADQVTDDYGNTYVTGQFQLAATFGDQTISSAGGDDIFVAKYNKDGGLVWLKKAGGIGYDRSNNITIDSKGNVYIIGWIGATAFFGSGKILKDAQAFIAKYDSSGNITWAKQLSQTYYYYYYYNNGDNLVTDKNDNLVMVGSYVGDSVRLGKIKLSGSGTNPISHFIAGIDPDGEITWAKRIATSKYNASAGYYYYHGISLVKDKDDGYYVTGRYSGHLEIGNVNLESKFNVKYPNSEYYQKLGVDIFVARLTNDGEVKWAKNVSGNLFYYYWGGYYYNYYHQGALTVDDNKNVYIAGGFGDTVLFPGNKMLVSKGGMDCYFAKYDSAGNFKWVKQYGGEFDDLITGLQIKNQKEICIVGNYFYQAYFDNVSITNDNGNNAFIALVDSAGTLKSIKEPYAQNGTSRAYHITKDIADNFYITGVFQGKMGLGPDTILNEGYDDIFVSRFGVCNVPPTLASTGNLELCYGESAGLSVKNIYNNYRWFRSGNEIKGANSNTFTATESGVYRVVVDSGLCSGVSNPITVNVSKKADLGEDKELCLGSSAILNPGNFSTYLWSDGSSGKTLLVNKTAKYYVRVTDNKGCVSTDTIQVTINAPPKPEIISHPKSTVCPGDTILLRTTIPYAEYQWYRNGQLMFGMTADRIKVTDVGNYSVRVKDITGCFNIDTIKIKNTELTPPAIVSSGPLSFCIGGDVILGVTSGYNKYQWFRNGFIIDGETSNFLNAKLPGQYRVHVDSGGCAIYSHPAIINVYPFPELNLDDSLVLCNGNPAELDGGEGYAKYKWNTGETTRKIIAQTNGLYMLTVENAFGCSVSDTIRVSIRGLDKPEILNRNDTLFSSPATKYQWYFNDIEINGATQNYYIPMFDGNYTVIITDEAGCTSKSEPKYYESRLTHKPGEPLEIKIFPNPTDGKVFIKFYFGPNVIVDAKVTLHDATGRLLQENAVTLNSNFSQTMSLNLETYSEGFYYLTVRLNDFSTVRKIVKVKP